MVLAKIDFDLMPKCVDFEVYGIDIMRNYKEIIYNKWGEEDD